MTSDAGYVRIYRRLLGHEAFRNDGEALAFAWMVIRASWQPWKGRYKSTPVSLERGQLAISVRDLADALDRQKGWVERLLTRLKNADMIRSEVRTKDGTASRTGVTIITICNYDEFQADQDKGRTASRTPRKTRAGQTQDTEQGREKGKKEEPIGSSPHSPPEDEPILFADDELPVDVVPEPPPAHRREKNWPEIPSWIPIPAWNGFIEMRRKNGKWPTDYAVSKLITKLDGLRTSGCDPGAVLDQSTVNGWTGVFAIKEDRNGYSGKAVDQRDGVSRLLDKRIADRAVERDARSAERSGFGAGDAIIEHAPAPARRL